MCCHIRKLCTWFGLHFFDQELVTAEDAEAGFFFARAKGREGGKRKDLIATEALSASGEGVDVEGGSLCEGSGGAGIEAEAECGDLDVGECADVESDRADGLAVGVLECDAEDIASKGEFVH